MAMRSLRDPVSTGTSLQFHGGASAKQVQVACSTLATSNMSGLPSTKGHVHIDPKRRSRGWGWPGRHFKFQHIALPFQANNMSMPTAAENITGSHGRLAHEGGVKSFTWLPDAKRPRICVLGGGFGGLYTALRLESLTWRPEQRPQVLLIDQSKRFVFKPLLYEILSKEVDQWEIAPTFKELLSNTSIQFYQDTVKCIQPCDAVNGNPVLASASNNVGGTVHLGSGAQIDYDWLVLALGAEPRLGIVPGATEYALPFSTLEDALEVDKRLLVLERERFGEGQSPIQVAIIGSGYCGVELAATLAERLGSRGQVKVVDMTSDICSTAPVGNREAALKVLASRNVELVLGYLISSIRGTSPELSSDGRASSLKPGSKGVVLDLKPATRGPSRRTSGAQSFEADLVLWTAGNRASIPPAESQSAYPPFPVNGRGQADTDEMLRVKGHPRIFAIGDSAGTKDSSGRLLPTTAQVAFQQADYAGWNLWAAINNRPLLPFRYQHLGEMMTLGTSDAAVSVSFIDGMTLDGILGHSARKLAYLYRLPTNEHKVKVGLSWVAKSTMSSLFFLQDSLTRLLSTS